MAEKLVNKAGLEEFASKVKEKMVFAESPSSGQVPRSLIDIFYPVGCYFETSDSSFNPNTAWGGTWVEDSFGKVTVAYQSGDTNFGTVGQTGGEKTHTLTYNEMPKHSHRFDHEEIAQMWSSGTKVWSSANTLSANALYVTTEGGDQPHNNLQPYIVVKRWHRTA